MKNRIVLLFLSLLSAALLSIPWLVPQSGALILVAFIPLLLADDMASYLGIRFFPYQYLCFLVWNAATTFWVCNATVGGGIFAVVCNAAQMALVWIVFRLGKKRFSGMLPYIFLATAWIAWERRYFFVDISWPWLTLGNAFASTTSLVQWYDITGHIGGSLWVWAVNLGIFGVVSSFADGSWMRWRPFARIVASLSLVFVIAGPMVFSRIHAEHLTDNGCGSLDVVIAQPNFDPYEKFESLTQAEQNEILIGLWSGKLEGRENDRVLLMAPETFTSDVCLDDVEASATVRAFRAFLEGHPNASILFGASTYSFSSARTAPSLQARPYGNGWVDSHNSALLIEKDREMQIFHKSKLVVGVEMLPYPKVLRPVENWLCGILGYSSLAGSCSGQDEITLLNAGGIPVGCAVCYESIYGEYCTGYERKGAQLMTVITNDAWWGDTPGYHQHLDYARLRAIELRRDIARCANTGISAFIDRSGNVLSETQWWERQTLCGRVSLYDSQTVFATYGDVCGRVCTFTFLLLLLLFCVRVAKKLLS